MYPFFILFIGILTGAYFLYLGVQGRKNKFERELHGPTQELPGVFEGTVQRYWWMFILFGVFYLLVGIVEFINSIES